MSKQTKNQKHQFVEGEIGAEFQSTQKSKLVERSNDNAPTKNSDTLENYYQLKTDAVDRLVNANAQTAPQIDDKTANPYKMDRLSRIPTWIKACFCKWWFAGAICFFFYWGFGTAIYDELDKMLVLSLGMGVTTDLLLNNAFRHFQSDDKEYNKWMMVCSKKIWAYFVNILYAAMLTWIVIYMYQGINLLAVALSLAEEGQIFLGVEPLLFGLLYLGCDCFFLMWKNLISKAVKNSKPPKNNT